MKSAISNVVMICRRSEDEQEAEIRDYYPRQGPMVGPYIYIASMSSRSYRSTARSSRAWIERPFELEVISIDAEDKATTERCFDHVPGNPI
jgi:hypothetical protein